MSSIQGFQYRVVEPQYVVFHTCESFNLGFNYQVLTL